MSMIDFKAIDILKQDLGEDILKQALSLVQKELEEADKIFHECLEKQDYKTFSRKAHSLKGSSMSFGFSDLRNVLLDLEQATLNDDNNICLDSIKDKLNLFKNERDYVLAEINKI